VPRWSVRGCASLPGMKQRRKRWSKRCLAPKHSIVDRCRRWAPRVCHPAPHHWCKVQPIAIFQGMDECPGDVVVSHCSARTPIGRGVGEGFHRKKSRPRFEGKWNAQPLAIGRRYEGELGPAACAQARPLHRLAARRTELGQGDPREQIDNSAYSARQLGKVPRRSRALLNFSLHCYNIRFTGG
jgi:hypothetical protein